MNVSAALKTRLRACRSLMLTPGSRPGLFHKAIAAGADAIIVDLESTVPPADKAKAREAALNYVSCCAPKSFVKLLRINSPRSSIGLEDLLALADSLCHPDAVVIPKCSGPADVQLVADLLTDIRSAAGIVPMIELAEAVFTVHQIASASDRVCGLFLGGGDLAADLGAQGSWENLLFARSTMVAAAAATGIAAIDVPYFGDDGAGLRTEALASRRLGMTGKASLRFDQLAWIDAVFTPPPEAVAHARAVIAAGRDGSYGTAVLDGQTIEPPMVREAERVLAIAEKLPELAAGATIADAAA